MKASLRKLLPASMVACVLADHFLRHRAQIG